MDEVRDQYEAFPYPERDPADESKRLIEGSPSDPAEVDHYVFGGQRDWAAPMRVLFAGGGTGDGLIMFAARCKAAGFMPEIVYLDLSEASLAIARARAEARGLTNIAFHNDSLLNAAAYGTFDYVDCCGVLHHLEDPQAGFDALSNVLTPEGGLGSMVYAPFGRSGVYPLQSAFNTLFAGEAYSDRLAPARAIVSALGKAHPFSQNQTVQDHKVSDAGFVDLLLHSQDKPFTVGEVLATLDQSGLELVSFIEPLRYRPEFYLPRDAQLATKAASLTEAQRSALAEQLSGTMKCHVFYAAKKGRANKPVSPSNLKLRPLLKRVSAMALAKQIQSKGEVRVTTEYGAVTLRMPKACTPLIAHIDGRRLSEIAQASGLSMIDFIKVWRPVHDQLTGVNMMLYSDGFGHVQGS